MPVLVETTAASMAVEDITVSKVATIVEATVSSVPGLALASLSFYGD